MSHLDRYNALLVTPDAAMALVPSGSRIAMGLGIAQPPALLAALAARAHQGKIERLAIYYLLSTSIAGQTVLSAELRDRIRAVSLFHSGVERAIEAAAGVRSCVDLIPTALHEVPTVLCDRVKVDTLVTTVAPMDAAGFFSLGTNIDYALAVARSGARVILEVNRHMPRVQGNCLVHISDVQAIVENHAPLLEIPASIPDEVDLKIAAIVAGLVDDGDCLQMGIGSIPQTVCAMLHDRRALGIHTELMMPGLADLMKVGAADNSRKQINPGQSVFTFAMGDRSFYEYLHENPLVRGEPVEYVNSPAVISRNERMVSINATLQVDLEGACNSEGIRGRQYSGAGGQVDFVRGAVASRKGRSIMACRSTAANGAISRIVPVLDGPVTTPRNDTHIVVTEHGWVDLKGRTLMERGRALVDLAAPQHRETLDRALYAKQGPC